MSALTRADLEQSHCDECGKQNDEMVLNGLCHPDSPTVAIYLKKRGVIRLKCSTCLKDVGDIAVAPGVA